MGVSSRQRQSSLLSLFWLVPLGTEAFSLNCLAPNARRIFPLSRQR